jgi:hypothetical protein
MTQFFIGNLLTGRRIQSLRAIQGSWSSSLNAAGELACTVSLRDPVMRRLGLRESALVGKTFLAAFDRDTGLQAGPIWVHDWDDDAGQLTLIAGGMWTYFDHRVLLPVLAGRQPSDPTTDTRYMPIDSDPESSYPWPTDTRKSLQGIARALVQQAQSWTGGNVPVLLPAEIAGDQEREYRGVDVARVGERLAQLTQALGGPDIRFTPRWTSDRLGVEWVMEIGTPTEPLLFSQLEPVFYSGVKKQSVTKLRKKTNGTQLASQAFGPGGAADDKALVSVSTDSTLLDAGFALYDTVDQTRSTVSDLATLQDYSDELVLRGRTPTEEWSFTHNLSRRPFISAFNVGDFAKVRVSNNLYIENKEHRLRIIGRSGDLKGETVDLVLEPEVI